MRHDTASAARVARDQNSGSSSTVRSVRATMRRNNAGANQVYAQNATLRSASGVASTGGKRPQSSTSAKPPNALKNLDF